MSISQRNLRGVSIDLKLNNFDLSGNTTDFNSKHCRRAHAHIDIIILFYIFATESVKICRGNLCSENLVADEMFQYTC